MSAEIRSPPVGGLRTLAGRVGGTLIIAAALLLPSATHGQDFASALMVLNVVNLFAIAILIAVPWLILAAMPIVVGCVLLVAAVSTPFYLRSKQRALRVFVQDLPSWQGYKATLSAMLAHHQEQVPDRTRACACMLGTTEHVELTVRVLQDHRCWSHRVKGPSPQIAVRRMERKLDRSQAGYRLSRHHYPTREFCANPWCCNSAHCPYRSGRRAA